MTTASRSQDACEAFIAKCGDDGVPVAEICRKAGIRQATCFNRKKKCAGALPDEMRRLLALDDENASQDRAFSGLMPSTGRPPQGVSIDRLEGGGSPALFSPSLPPPPQVQGYI